MSEPDAPPAAPPVSRGRRWRLVALALVIVSAAALGKLSGVTDDLDEDRIRAAVQAAGWRGPLLFWALFVVAYQMNVPGLMFLFAAVALWGRLEGGAIAYVGGLLAMAVTFAIVRAVGGRPLGAVKARLLVRLLANLDARPVTTIAAARAIFILATPLTYALALSNVRFRDFMLGNALGLVPPYVLFAVVFQGLLD